MFGAAVHSKLGFGPFELSIGERVLLREGVMLPLGGRALDVLIYLAPLWPIRRDNFQNYISCRVSVTRRVDADFRGKLNAVKEIEAGYLPKLCGAFAFVSGLNAEG